MPDNHRVEYLGDGRFKHIYERPSFDQIVKRHILHFCNDTYEAKGEGIAYVAERQFYEVFVKQTVWISGVITTYTPLDVCQQFCDDNGLEFMFDKTKRYYVFTKKKESGTDERRREETDIAGVGEAPDRT